MTEAERHDLQALIQRHSTPQQIALRARIILLAVAGQNQAQVAQSLNTSIDTARLWRQRWLAWPPIAWADLSVAERLEDLPRPGRPPRLTADQICQIEPRACQKPEQSERPTLAPSPAPGAAGDKRAGRVRVRQWTGREIADEGMKRGMVDTISPRPAARLLKRGTFSRT